MTLDLTILATTPSLNHWANTTPAVARWKYRDLRQRWLRHVNDALLEARSQGVMATRFWPRPPQTRVDVSVIRYAPPHHWLDEDNLTGGLKPLLDALKALELIRDDNPRAIALHVSQAVSPYQAPHRWSRVTLAVDHPAGREVRA